MNWFGITKHHGVSVPTMARGKSEAPIGFVFFTTEEKLDVFSLKQNKRVHVPYELGKDMSLEKYAYLATMLFAEVTEDVKVATGIVVRGVPVFIDLEDPLNEADREPDYPNLHQFAIETLPEEEYLTCDLLGSHSYKGMFIILVRMKSTGKIVAFVSPKNYEALKAGMLDPGVQTVEQLFESEADALSAAKKIVETWGNGICHA